MFLQSHQVSCQWWRSQTHWQAKGYFGPSNNQPPHALTPPLRRCWPAVDRAASCGRCPPPHPLSHWPPRERPGRKLPFCGCRWHFEVTYVLGSSFWALIVWSVWSWLGRFLILEATSSISLYCSSKSLTSPKEQENSSNWNTFLEWHNLTKTLGQIPNPSAPPYCIWSCKSCLKGFFFFKEP